MATARWESRRAVMMMSGKHPLMGDITKDMSRELLYKGSLLTSSNIGVSKHLLLLIGTLIA